MGKNFNKNYQLVFERLYGGVILRNDEYRKYWLSDNTGIANPLCSIAPCYPIMAITPNPIETLRKIRRGNKNGC